MIMTPTSSCKNKALLFKRPSSKNAPNPLPKPLTQSFFDNLMRLETEFTTKNYDLTVLDELVQQYAKAVEYYDSVQDKITIYFTFKIQDVLSTRQSLKMLLDQKTTSDKQDASPNMSVNTSLTLSRSKTARIDFVERDAPSPTIAEDHAEGDEDEEKDENRKSELAKYRSSKGPKSFASIRNQRQRFVTLFQKVESAKVEEEQNIQTMYEKFSDSAQNNDVVIKSSIDLQKERLRQKLEKKKNESFLSYTLNNSMTSFMGSPYESLNSSRVGDVLNELNFDDNVETQKDGPISSLIKDLVGTPVKAFHDKHKKHLRSKSLFSVKPVEFSGNKTPAGSLVQKYGPTTEARITHDENDEYRNQGKSSLELENSFTTATTPFDTKTCVVEVDCFDAEETNSML